MLKHSWVFFHKRVQFYFHKNNLNAELLVVTMIKQVECKNTMKRYFVDHPFLPTMQLHMQLLFDLHDSRANQAPSHESLSTFHFWLLHQQWKLPLPGLLLAPLATHMPLPKIPFKSLSHLALVDAWRSTCFNKNMKQRQCLNWVRRFSVLPLYAQWILKSHASTQHHFQDVDESCPKIQTWLWKWKSLLDLFRWSFQWMLQRRKYESWHRLYFLL